MKLAIMQPYLFPYLGYFQLAAAVDKFVFYDDVNYIKNGWINRNRLSLAGEVRYITIPLAGASSFLKINQILVQKHSLWQRKIIESVRHSYSKAPKFTDVSNLFSEVLLADECCISEIAKRSVVAVSRYLGLKTQFVMSSSRYGNAHYVGSDRVLDICQQENATNYYNLPGGKNLYNDEMFHANGITLRFIKPNLGLYRQFSGEFIPGLSIIDVLMFNDRDIARELLTTELGS